jgi:pimeloyl-ACP methyl ester carboxylesterase
MAAAASGNDRVGADVVRDPGGPEGFLVALDAATRLHFLDWSGPVGGAPGVPVVLLHGLAATAWIWAPVARRLAATGRVVAVDLRGHGLSDAPIDGYGLASLAADVQAVLEGAGLDDGPGPGPVVAGHGFGAMVAAALAAELGPRCSGLVLVDGGWEDMGSEAGAEPEEFLRALEEPPEVLRSMADYLADRKAFDPASWDADQERAARAAAVELPAGRVVPVTRPHVLAGLVETMFAYRPSTTLPLVTAPISIVVAGETPTQDPSATGADRAPADRRRALRALVTGLVREGRTAPEVLDLVGVGHNVMRYRPAELTAVIEKVRRPPGAYHPGS